MTPYELRSNPDNVFYYSCDTGLRFCHRRNNFFRPTYNYQLEHLMMLEIIFLNGLNLHIVCQKMFFLVFVISIVQSRISNKQSTHEGSFESQRK